jgi:hypothetical protein
MRIESEMAYSLVSALAAVMEAIGKDIKEPHNVSWHDSKAECRRGDGSHHGQEWKRDSNAGSRACGWKTRLINPKRHEERYSRHVSTFHSSIRS